MANITLLKDGKVMWYFPISAGGSVHVPLAMVDELQPGTAVSVTAACEGSGTLILDIDILEVNGLG
jgi:assimilatory nitrate reductase catalytic subunit